MTGTRDARPFTVLGIQQVAIGGRAKARLRALWVDMLGLEVSGNFRSERENVDEDICAIGSGANRVEVDLMEPIDPEGKPAVHATPLNHIGLWIDDLPAAVAWLTARGVVFIEQPMPKAQLDDTAWLRERSPLPLIADENCQRLADIAALRGVFDGINIKLMKCTGLREAHQMIVLARALGMKTMLGCMTETSCAISAAAQLSPLVDWADLDGAVLIKNDCFDGATIVDGKLVLPDRTGIGVIKRG